MGECSGARCLDCGEPFTVSSGGGFGFHLVRCDACGVEKSIGFDELAELHLRYLKGLSGPYAMITAEHDKYVRELVPVEPISEPGCWAGIEAAAGSCGAADDSHSVRRHGIQHAGHQTSKRTACRSFVTTEPATLHGVLEIDWGS